MGLNDSIEGSNPSFCASATPRSRTPAAGRQSRRLKLGGFLVVCCLLVAALLSLSSTLRIESEGSLAIDGGTISTKQVLQASHPSGWRAVPLAARGPISSRLGAVETEYLVRPAS